MSKKKLKEWLRLYAIGSKTEKEEILEILLDYINGLEKIIKGDKK